MFIPVLLNFFSEACSSRVDFMDYRAGEREVQSFCVTKLKLTEHVDGGQCYYKISQVLMKGSGSLNPEFNCLFLEFN